MSRGDYFDDPDAEAQQWIPPAFVKRFGDLRIPNSGDVAAWKKGRLCGGPVGKRFDVFGRPIADVAPVVARDRHPVTGKWTPSWRKRPTGLGMVAQIRTRFKAGDPRTIRAASRSTPAKREAARRNGLLGGRPKKAKRPQAEA